MRLVSLAVLASASILVAGPARAQAPLTEKNVSMAMSLAIIQGALEQCTKDGYKVSVTIVDKGGNVAASLRGDGTGPHTMEFSRLKAYTARTRNQTSLQTMKLLEDPANAFIRQIPGVVGVGGGVPIGRQRDDRRRRRIRRARRRKGRSLRQCRPRQGRGRAEVDRGLEVRDARPLHTAISCAGAAAARFCFFTLAGGNSEHAASPAVSATPGSPDTMAATMAPSIRSAS